jgi:hypothetical protein
MKGALVYANPVRVRQTGYNSEGNKNNKTFEPPILSVSRIGDGADAILSEIIKLDAMRYLLPLATLKKPQKKNRSVSSKTRLIKDVSGDLR